MKISNHSKYFYLLLFISILIISLSVYLGVRSYMRVRHYPRPVPHQTDVHLIQSWMTLTYISRAYGVPKNTLLEKLDISTDTNIKMSLDNLAKNLHRDPKVFIQDIQNIITECQASHGGNN